MHVLSRTRHNLGEDSSKRQRLLCIRKWAEPLYNETGGRDHWPYTSVMLMGAGIRGGQSFGGFDDQFTGIGFDPNTGQASTTSWAYPLLTLAPLWFT